MNRYVTFMRKKKLESYEQKDNRRMIKNAV